MSYTDYNTATVNIALKDYTVVGDPDILGPIRFNLPPAVNTMKGKLFVLKNIARTHSSDVVSIYPDGTDEIDGDNTPFELYSTTSTNRYNAIGLQCNGAGWEIIYTHHIH